MEELEENKIDNSSIELEDVIDSVDTYFTPQVKSDLSKVIIVTPDKVKKAILASTSEFVIYEDETLEQCTKRYIEMALLKITKDEFLKEENAIDSEEFMAAFVEGDIKEYTKLTLAAATKKLEAELGELKGNALKDLKNAVERLEVFNSIGSIYQWGVEVLNKCGIKYKGLKENKKSLKESKEFFVGDKTAQGFEVCMIEDSKKYYL